MSGKRRALAGPAPRDAQREPTAVPAHFEQGGWKVSVSSPAPVRLQRHSSGPVSGFRCQAARRQPRKVPGCRSIRSDRNEASDGLSDASGAVARALARKARMTAPRTGGVAAEIRPRNGMTLFMFHLVGPPLARPARQAGADLRPAGHSPARETAGVPDRWRTPPATAGSRSRTATAIVVHVLPQLIFRVLSKVLGTADTEPFCHCPKAGSTVPWCVKTIPWYGNVGTGWVGRQRSTGVCPILSSTPAHMPRWQEKALESFPDFGEGFQRRVLAILRCVHRISAQWRRQVVPCSAPPQAQTHDKLRPRRTIRKHRVDGITPARAFRNPRP